ncbi:MAG: hypothetical protein ACFFCW_38590 [Candidatus Hodarchaeota archaeon]
MGTQRNSIPDSMRQGIITAIALILGFAFTFITLWAFEPGEWERWDAIPAVPLVVGIGFLVYALFRVIDPSHLDDEYFKASRKWFLVGVLVFFGAVILSLIVEAIF